MLAFVLFATPASHAISQEGLGECVISDIGTQTFWGLLKAYFQEGKLTIKEFHAFGDEVKQSEVLTCRHVDVVVVKYLSTAVERAARK